MYDRTIVQGAIFNMRDQLYRGNANATALFSSPVVSAVVRALVLAGARRCTLKTCGKKCELRFQAWINLYITIISSECGVLVNSTLKSPGYPFSYPANMDCEYSVPIPPGGPMRIHFVDFDVEYHSSCRQESPLCHELNIFHCRQPVQEFSV